MTENEKNTKVFIDAIRKLAENEENLENLEFYLDKHFETWMKNFAGYPAGLASEMKNFAEME